MASLVTFHQTNLYPRLIFRLWTKSARGAFSQQHGAVPKCSRPRYIFAFQVTFHQTICTCVLFFWLTAPPGNRDRGIVALRGCAKMLLSQVNFQSVDLFFLTLCRQEYFVFVRKTRLSFRKTSFRFKVSRLWRRSAPGGSSRPRGVHPRLHQIYSRDTQKTGGV